jgi:hypothetical protein
MKPTVRATRAYLAGLGTSGSLLAGAALVFVLGSAIVAFRGWPQISTGPASVVVAAAHPAAQPSRVARRLATVLRRQRASGGAALTPTAARRAARADKSRRRIATRTAPVAGAPSGISVAASRSSAAAASAGARSAPPCGSACHHPSLVSQLTKTVSREVSNVGASVGSGVSHASGSVGGSLNGVSPQAGNAVQNLGSSAGNTIAGTSTTAANTLTQAGSALSAGH